MSVPLIDQSSTPAPNSPLTCYQCSKSNPHQRHCGHCGAPLNLNDYISFKVADDVRHSIRDRDVLEKESSIAVFTRAWGWMKLVLGIAIGLLVLVGFGTAWKASDLWDSVDKAKKSVTDTASTSSQDIRDVASGSKRDISEALSSSKQAIEIASDKATKQSNALTNDAARAKKEISNERQDFESDLHDSQQRLQAANALQPQMTDRNAIAK
jgi:hypothetical protein